jgi:hypothetical protein
MTSKSPASTRSSRPVRQSPSREQAETARCGSDGRSWSMPATRPARVEPAAQGRSRAQPRDTARRRLGLRSGRTSDLGWGSRRRAGPSRPRESERRRSRRSRAGGSTPIAGVNAHATAASPRLVHVAQPERKILFRMIDGRRSDFHEGIGRAPCVGPSACAVEEIEPLRQQLDELPRIGRGQADALAALAPCYRGASPCTLGQGPLRRKERKHASPCTCARSAGW